MRMSGSYVSGLLIILNGQQCDVKYKSTFALSKAFIDKQFHLAKHFTNSKLQMLYMLVRHETIHLFCHSLHTKHKWQYK